MSNSSSYPSPEGSLESNQDQDFMLIVPEAKMHTDFSCSPDESHNFVEIKIVSTLTITPRTAKQLSENLNDPEQRRRYLVRLIETQLEHNPDKEGVRRQISDRLLDEALCLMND